MPKDNFVRSNWDKSALQLSPLFRPLWEQVERLPAERFPTLDDCNDLLLAHEPAICVQRGAALRFVAQSQGKLPFDARYEPRCYLRGEVQTRADNWHDLLNALVWLAFPRTKAVINARHYQALTAPTCLEAETGSQRGVVRDMITLFDESGVVVAYADDELADLLRGFQWHELFWRRREQVRKRMGFFLFGHGLYEKALYPYVGMTGQGLLLPVPSDFFDRSVACQVAHLDGLVADYLAIPEHCVRTSELTPVPLLGVPDWSPDNTEESYYCNTAYFRPGRRR